MNLKTASTGNALAAKRPGAAQPQLRAAEAPAGKQAVDAADSRYPPLFQSMLAVSLLGSTYGREDDADLIALPLEPTLPDPLAYRVNRALAQGLCGNGRAAEVTLKAILEQNPDDDCTKVVLAVSKMLSGDPEWMTILENLFASSTDTVARDTARNVIAYLMQSKF